MFLLGNERLEMKDYIIKSTFTVANQIVRVELMSVDEKRAVELPIKWAQYLHVGKKFTILESCLTGAPVAYIFNNQMCFPYPVVQPSQARRIINMCRTWRDFSFEFIWFQYALATAMRSQGVTPRASCIKNIMALDRANQR